MGTDRISLKLIGHIRSIAGLMYPAFRFWIQTDTFRGGILQWFHFRNQFENPHQNISDKLERVTRMLKLVSLHVTLYYIFAVCCHRKILFLDVQYFVLSLFTLQSLSTGRIKHIHIACKRKIIKILSQ